MPAPKQPQEGALTSGGHTEAEHLHMMQTPDLWPCWPVLPLKKRDHTFKDREFGILIADRGPTVYYANLYAVGTLHAEDVLPWDHTTYASFEEIIAAGWVVD